MHSGSFAGAQARETKLNCKPAEEDNPRLYILDVGTNSLKENESAEETADEITSPAWMLKKDNNKVSYLH